jgi:hypothetical protein
MHEANLLAAMTIVAVLVLLLGVGRAARVRY